MSARASPASDGIWARVGPRGGAGVLVLGQALEALHEVPLRRGLVRARLGDLVPCVLLRQRGRHEPVDVRQAVERGVMPSCASE